MEENPAALLKRISDLERERDELHLDIEQLCMQQSGMSSKADALSQIQARSIASLKKELEISKVMLDDCMKKNEKLEDELTEVYKIKSQFADLLQTETDKNIELEKNIKFFQTTVATALGERDRAIIEVDRTHERERELTLRINELENRMELLSSEIHNQRKVIDLFWEIRDKESNLGDIDEYDKKVAILLGDSHDSWTYGDKEKELEILRAHIKEREMAMALLQEKYQASAVSVSNLTSELDKVVRLKKLAEDQFVEHKEKMVCSVIVLAEKIKRIQSELSGFKKELMKALEDAAELPKSFVQTFQMKLQTSHNMNESTDGILTSYPNNERKVLHGDFTMETDENSRNLAKKDSEMQILDLKEALALALQEKVTALLLLAQQEERRILEENTIAAQEYQITELQTQLFKATADKAKALMQLSNIWKEFKETHDRHFKGSHAVNSRDYAFGTVSDSTVEKGTAKLLGNIQEQSNGGGNISPRWVWSKAFTEESMKEQAQTHGGRDTHDISRYWVPKYWSKDEFHKSGDDTSVTIRPGRDSSVSRLQAENTALWDVLTILCQISRRVIEMHRRVLEVCEFLEVCESSKSSNGDGVHTSNMVRFAERSLRSLRFQVAKGTWKEHASSRVSMLDSVIAEGKKLRLAFGNPDSTNELMKMGSDDTKSWFLNAAKSAEVNVAAPFGGPLLDSIILAAEICKTCLASHGTLSPCAPSPCIKP